MNTTPIIRSKLAWINFCTYIAMATLCLVFSIWLIFYRPDGLPLMLLALASGILSVVYFIRILNIDIWIIDADKLLIKPLSGLKRREINLSDIVSWSEIEVRTLFGHYQRLTLYTTNANFHFLSCHYSNYYPMRLLLTSQKPQNAQKMKGER